MRKTKARRRIDLVAILEEIAANPNGTDTARVAAVRKLMAIDEAAKQPPVSKRATVEEKRNRARDEANRRAVAMMKGGALH
jgi:hypothetical protein